MCASAPDFPQLIRQIGAEHADILLAPSNDWEAIKQVHAAMAVFRGIENGVSLVRATSSGISIATDPYGRVLTTTDHFWPGARVMVAQVPTERVPTIYGYIGDLFAWSCIAGLAATIVLAIARVVRWALDALIFSSMGTVVIRRSTLTSPEATRLIAALNAELQAAFPEPGANHFSLSSSQVQVGDGAFVVAYLDEVAVGCGAVRRLDEATAELKRMFVDPSVRGQRIGRAIVEALEGEARRLGITRVVLETGTRLAPAIKLYESMGYTSIPLFGEYLSSPDTSLCFGKSLAGC